MKAIAPILFMVLILAGCRDQQAEDQAKKEMNTAEFSKFVDDDFQAAVETNPGFGTASGIHEFDSKLNDMSRAGVERRIAQLKDLQARLDPVARGPLSPADAIDAEILEHQIRAELLDLE